MDQPPEHSPAGKAMREAEARGRVPPSASDSTATKSSRPKHSTANKKPAKYAPNEHVELQKAIRVIQKAASTSSQDLRREIAEATATARPLPTTPAPSASAKAESSKSSLELRDFEDLEQHTEPIVPPIKDVMSESAKKCRAS